MSFHLAHARKLHTYASTHTQSKRKSQHSHTESTTAQRLLAAAANRPNSSSSSTQQRRRRGSGGSQLRTSEPPIVRLMTQCLGGCALTYASARGVRTKCKRKSQHSHTVEATTAQRLFAAAADRPNSSSSSTQQRWRRGRGGASYERASLLSSV